MKVRAGHGKEAPPRRGTRNGASMSTKPPRSMASAARLVAHWSAELGDAGSTPADDATNVGEVNFAYTRRPPRGTSRRSHHLSAFRVKVRGPPDE